MKWLVDAQLPPTLCSWFRTQGEEARHVRDLAVGLTAGDKFLWDFAKEEGWVLVTKDKDFFDWSIIIGAPPQVLLVQVGNCSNERLLSIFIQTKDDWFRAFKEGHPLVVLTPDGSQTFQSLP